MPIVLQASSGTRGAMPPASSENLFPFSLLALSDDGACWIAHDTVLVEGLVVSVVIVDEPVIIHPGDVVAIEVHNSMIFQQSVSCCPVFVPYYVDFFFFGFWS